MLEEVIRRIGQVLNMSIFLVSKLLNSQSTRRFYLTLVQTGLSFYHYGGQPRFFPLFPLSFDLPLSICWERQDLSAWMFYLIEPRHLRSSRSSLTWVFFSFLWQGRSYRSQIVSWTAYVLIFVQPIRWTSTFPIPSQNSVVLHSK